MHERGTSGEDNFAHRETCDTSHQPDVQESPQRARSTFEYER